jgi:hypothetical protein
MKASPAQIHTSVPALAPEGRLVNDQCGQLLVGEAGFSFHSP